VITTADGPELSATALNVRYHLHTWLNINKCKTAFYGRDVNYEYKYYLSSTSLESADVIKDLGVVFDSKLSFVSHCKEKINRAYSMLNFV